MDGLTESTTSRVAPRAARHEQTFPRLSATQIARIAHHGRAREVAAGEVLVEAGQHAVPFFLITRGRVEVIQPTLAGEALVAIHEPGQFSGEVSLISGRRSLVRMRAAEPSEVIELARGELQALVQTDAELGELILRAFILRRVELIARGYGDVVLLGSVHCAGTLRVKAFLSRNGHPYTYVDLDHDRDVQGLLDRFHVGIDEVPVLICRGELVLKNPTLAEIAECLGLNAEVDAARVRDVVIIGGGPAGLAAAVYGASEGLDVLVVESTAPGGQAASSSKIENYLGFPTGISGQALAARAYTQAQKFGAQMLIASGASKLACDQRPYAIETLGGTRVSARAVIIATGADYRRLELPDLARFEGAGIYYGATFIEAQLCSGEDVVVVGGGNSAGQAAVFLAQSARKVLMMVRSSGLADSMSRYLIRRIEESPTIELRTFTEVAALAGTDHLEEVSWRDTRTVTVETRPIRHVFVMTGASPCTHWLEGRVTLDPKGFIKTGPDLSTDDLGNARWPLARPPHLLETSLPGVFAVGDVRCGNVKRVASAVGEGSIAVSFVHQVLHE
ncbi:MAG: FAD-dependent oxidoreductase [Deltaproteobacteria bacterium]|nr:FAD-dependent oxidoreductase [Deltaproteobacteria bacterium]